MVTTQPAALEFSLNGVLRILHVKPQAGTCVVTLRYENFSITVKGQEMAYQLPSNMKVGVEVKYVDAEGNPAVVDGDVKWSSSDDTIASVVVDTTNSQRAVVEAIGPVGNVQISASADADLGEGKRELVTLMDVTVIAGEAVAGVIEPSGAPQPVKA